VTNVALVVLDTLRSDAFDDAFEWLEGRRFTRAYSSSHWTIPAHASLFTGRYASEVGVHGRSPALDCPEETIAEAFRDDGYHTRCLTANPQLYQYDGWRRGFDEFLGPGNIERTDDAIFDWRGHVDETEPGIGRYLSGVRRCFGDQYDTVESLRFGLSLYRKPSWDGGARAVRERLSKTTPTDPELLVVNLMDAHTPYHPAPGSDEPVSVVIADALAGSIEDPDRIRAAYRASVDHLAATYRDIVAELEAEYDYVITLSDHGELLGEHGLWNHSVSLHPELVHVPLVVSGPGVQPGTCDDVVSILDVHRTVGELAGVDLDSGGRDLFGPLEPKEHLVESHGLLPFHRDQFERKGCSLSAFERWQSDLHGLLTRDGAYCYESEPGEFRIVGETAVDDPRGRLEELVADLDTRSVEDADVAVSTTVRNRLEELGYA
jgi:arylsulfatase